VSASADIEYKEKILLAMMVLRIFIQGLQNKRMTLKD